MFEFVLDFLTSTNIALLALTLGLAYVIMTCVTHARDLPPMASWRLPLFGHLLFLKPSLHVKFDEWRKSNGDIFSIYLGSQLTVVLNTHELIHEAFVKMGDKFSDRPKDFRVDHFPEVTKGIIFNSGNAWKENRNVGMVILKAFGMGKNWLGEKIAEEVKSYTDELHSLQNSPQDPSTLTGEAVANIICVLLLGYRFEYDDPVFLRYMDLNYQFMKFNMTTTLLNILPFLMHLPGDVVGIKAYEKVVKEITDSFSNPYIQKFQAELDDTTNDNYIKAYLREFRKRKEAGEDTTLDESQLRRHLDDLFLAGSETSATTITWSMLYILNYPEVQKKLQKELDEVVGRARMPTLQDKAQLPYMNAFIMEIQRIASIAPLAAFHMCTETSQLAGHRIPKGTTVISNLYTVLHDERVWQDPHSLKPERFLDDDNKLITPKEFIPFNIGRRYCMGEALARMELFLFMSAIYHRFELHPEDPNNPPTLNPVVVGVLKPPAFKVIFKERL